MSDVEIRELARSAPGSVERYRWRLALVRAGRESEAGLEVGDRVRTTPGTVPAGTGIIRRAEGVIHVVRFESERTDYDRIAAEHGIDALLEAVARERLVMMRDLTTTLVRPWEGAFAACALQLLDPMPPGVRLTKDRAWTIVHRVVDGVLKETSCCCKAPGSTPEGCRVASKHKARCRCYCRSRRIR